MTFWTLNGHAGAHDTRNPQLGIGFARIEDAREAWQAAGCPRIWGSSISATEHSPSGVALRTLTLSPGPASAAPPQPPQGGA